MNNEFLLELYSEEIPSKMQPKARKDFLNLFNNLLNEYNINTNIEVFSSSCRLILYIKNLPNIIKIITKQKRGPRIDAPENAINGFLKSVNLDSISDLAQIDINGVKYYQSEAKTTEVKTTDILKEKLPKLLNDMCNLWPKTMKWTDNPEIRWIRPLKNILCLFDGNIMDFEFFGLKSNNKSFGHKILKGNSFAVNSFAEYREKLRESYVVFDQNEREKIIREGLEKSSKELGFSLYEEDLNIEKPTSMINEAIGLTEYPVVLAGKIEDRFMELPKEIIINTIRINQKYFCLKTKNNDLSNSFLFVSNVKTTDNNKSIIYGNEKVLKARLNDALFYVNEDLRFPLVNRLELLKHIVFQEKVGSLYDKIMRMLSLAKLISIWIKHADILKIEKVVKLSKIDLTTNTVSEIPELQGFIGGYYAEAQKEDEDVVEAIKEHYKPVGINDSLPETPLGILLSLTDKFDTIAAMFLANEIPTSSKDPYALRRATLGIIRILIENNIDIDLNIIFNNSLKTFSISILKKNMLEEDKNTEKLKIRVKKEILNFFKERLRVYLKDNNYNPIIVDAVIKKYLEEKCFDKKEIFNILDILDTVKQLQKFANSQKYEETLGIYKRVHNILENFINKDEFKQSKLNIVFKKYLKKDEEKVLYNNIKDIYKTTKKLYKEKKYIEILEKVSTIKNSLDAFFDNVTVDSDIKEEKQNRLLILCYIENIFNRVVDFSNF